MATKPQPVLELRLSAIGRYAHVVPSQERVDFGSLLVGQKEGASRDIYLRNTSTVPATASLLDCFYFELQLKDPISLKVKCSRLESDREPVFTVSPMELVVPPQSEAKVRPYLTPGRLSEFNYRPADRCRSLSPLSARDATRWSTSRSRPRAATRRASPAPGSRRGPRCGCTRRRTSGRRASGSTTA